MADQKTVYDKEHVSLETLIKKKDLNEETRKCLDQKIPPYPSPVEFQVSKVAHVTDDSGLMGILDSEQFRPPNSEFSWWDLKITEEEIKEAAKNYITTNNLKRTTLSLEKFTTSPAFKTESRYGNYPFIFPLSDLMDWYKEQNCGGEEPVLRVYQTVTYKQEIMYTVLIHSPEDNERFGENPLLTKSDWVRYKDGKIIWKAQAICGTHNYKLVQKVTKIEPGLRYVWDQVSLAFHLPNKAGPAKALKIPRETLIEALKVCKQKKKLRKLFSELKEKMNEFERALEEA